MSEEFLQAAGDLSYWRQRAEQAEAAATAYKDDLELIAKEVGANLKRAAQVYYAVRAQSKAISEQEHMIDELRWQLRQVLEFYHTPPPIMLAGWPRYQLLVEAWRMCAEPEKERPKE